MNKQTRTRLTIRSPTCNSPVSQRPARLPCLYACLSISIGLLQCNASSPIGNKNFHVCAANWGHEPSLNVS
ncbi:hypothetical protein BAE44_0013054 [Dichanthelium oligosanthes]|uniref:Uncharacterized protein n=1 Tax=Dichanthelium oligosanthes TaxID=888268 RepID=A0A1E5VLB8_9POAL|nr:hypothetical protein BAE44_0013054 [Dichanthelium oligosanthes]